MSPTGKKQIVRVGEWQLLAQLNLLRRADKEIHLEPRHADLLAFMAEHQGELFTADQIIEQVWQGQLVTEQSVYQAIAKLRRALGDRASNPVYIETVSKRGYRLIAEVGRTTATDVAPIAPTAEAGKKSSSRLAAPKPALAYIGTAVLLVLGLALLVGLMTLRSEAPETERPAIPTVMVLPLKSLTDNPSDQLIADGFAIELGHAIGRSDLVRIIGPVSTRLAAGLGQDPRRAGSGVDADILVSGTIRQSNGTYRISSELTDVNTGLQLWSGVFDSSEQDILEAQFTIAERVVEALSLNLEGAPVIAAPNRPDRQKAYDDYLLGRHYRNQRNGADLQRALEYFNEALAEDPELVPAMRELAVTQLLRSFYDDLPLAQAVSSADQYLRQAAALEPDSPELAASVGLSHYLQGNYGLAEDFLQRAVKDHPNLAEAWMWLGLARRQQGRLNEAIVAFAQTARLEPLLVTGKVNYAYALAWHGDDDAAARLLRRLAGDGGPSQSPSLGNSEQLLRALSGVLREQGDLVESYRWAQKALETAPQSPLSLANKALVAAMLERRDRATELALQAHGETPPGRGTMDYLARAGIAAPGLLEAVPIERFLQRLQRQPDLPEIEWRIANLYVGMRGYFSGLDEVAIEHLGKALDGRDYPIKRPDDDLFVCGSLADVLQRAGKLQEAKQRLKGCLEDEQTARSMGWNSLSLAISGVRLAVLSGDTQGAAERLNQLFDKGMRLRFLLQRDPILLKLADTQAYRRLLDKITRAISEANQRLDLGTKR